MILFRTLFCAGKNHVPEPTGRPVGPLRIQFFSSSPGTLSAEALYPLLASGYSHLETVTQDYKKLFGTKPKHPQEGEYYWDRYELSSTQYGTPSNKKRPPYEDGDRDFGLFSHFETFSLKTVGRLTNKALLSNGYEYQ